MTREISKKEILANLQRFSNLCTVILLLVHQKKYSQPQINEICKILHMANNSSFEAMIIICQNKMLDIAGGKYEVGELEKLCQMLENFISEKESRDKTAPKKCGNVRCRLCETCQEMG